MSKFRRKATEDPIFNMEMEESVDSSEDLMLFDDELNVLDDMEIDSFTVDGEPIPFGCATSSVILPEEFMMQQGDAEEEVIEIQNTRGAIPLEDENLSVELQFRPLGQISLKESSWRNHLWKLLDTSSLFTSEHILMANPSPGFLLTMGRS